MIDAFNITCFCNLMLSNVRASGKKRCNCSCFEMIKKWTPSYWLSPLFTEFSESSLNQYNIARNDRWFAHLHIQNGGSKRIWILTYSWTGNFLLAWAGQFAGIKNQTMHRFEQYLKILQLYHENSRFPPSFKFEA
jgi:hypothetical protein